MEHCEKAANWGNCGNVQLLCWMTNGTSSTEGAIDDELSSQHILEMKNKAIYHVCEDEL